MNLFSSLTNRIFFATALLAVLSIGVAVYRVNVAVTAQAESELRRGVEEAGDAARRVPRARCSRPSPARPASLPTCPNLKAAMDTNDPDTVQPIAEEYQHRIESDLFLVTEPTGQVLARAGRLQMPPTMRPRTRRFAAPDGTRRVSLWTHSGGIVQVATVPSFLAGELMGTSASASASTRRLAARFKALTNSEMAFASATRSRHRRCRVQFDADLARVVGAAGVRTIVSATASTSRVSRKLPFSPIAARRADRAAAMLPTALILRSRTDRLRFLNIVHRELAGTAFLAVLAATLLSYAVARTVTRPLGAITATMREMAATGDLTRKITLQPTRAGTTRTHGCWRRRSTR